MILKEEQLLELCEGIELVDAYINEKPGIVLNMSIPDYIGFCKKKGVSTIYYDIKYFDKDFYLITDEIISKYTDNKKEQSFCKKWANDVNAQFNSLDFERPFALKLACIIDSVIIGCEDVDYWIPKDTPSGDVSLIQYIEDHEDDLDALYEEDHDEELALSDELKQVLYADSGFRCSTTISSRKQYVRTFLSKKNNKKYLGLVRKATQPWEKEDQFRDIVNRFYEEYRNTCRSLKIHIGDPLPEEDN